MHLLKFTIGIFTFSAVLFAAFALHAAALSFDKSDFKSAQVSKQKNGSLVMVQFSKFGSSKAKSLEAKDQIIEVNLAGGTHKLKLRGPLEGDQAQLGPFTKEIAKKIAQEINSQQ